MAMMRRRHHQPTLLLLLFLQLPLVYLFSPLMQVRVPQAAATASLPAVTAAAATAFRNSEGSGSVRSNVDDSGAKSGTTGGSSSGSGSRSEIGGNDSSGWYIGDASLRAAVIAAGFGSDGCNVERVTDPTVATHWLKRLRAGKLSIPLVLSGVAAPHVLDPQMEKTLVNRAALLEKYGKATVSVRWPVGANQVGALVRTTTLGAYLRAIASGSASNSSSRIAAAGLLFDWPKAIMEDVAAPDGDTNKNVDSDSSGSGSGHGHSHGGGGGGGGSGSRPLPPTLAQMAGSMVLSIGPDGSGLPMHNHASAFLRVLTGEKLFAFLPPLLPDGTGEWGHAAVAKEEENDANNIEDSSGYGRDGGDTENNNASTTTTSTTGSSSSSSATGAGAAAAADFERELASLVLPASADVFLKHLGNASARTQRALAHCVVGPGDLVLIPCNWYHATLNLGASVAVGGQAAAGGGGGGTGSVRSSGSSSRGSGKSEKVLDKMRDQCPRDRFGEASALFSRARTAQKRARRALEAAEDKVEDDGGDGNENAAMVTAAEKAIDQAVAIVRAACAANKFHLSCGLEETSLLAGTPKASFDSLQGWIGGYRDMLHAGTLGPRLHALLMSAYALELTTGRAYARDQKALALAAFMAEQLALAGPPASRGAIARLILASTRLVMATSAPVTRQELVKARKLSKELRDGGRERPADWHYAPLDRRVDIAALARQLERLATSIEGTLERMERDTKADGSGGSVSSSRKNREKSARSTSTLRPSHNEL